MCSEAVAVESVGSSTSPISRLNPNRLSLGHNQTTPMSRSMERDTCYFCEQKGHWASKCPQKSKPSPSSGSTIIDGRDFPDMPCPCGAGICIVLTSKTTKNPNRKFYRCPAPASVRCDFFKWCDTVTSNRSPNVVETSYPTCSCGAGNCILRTEKDGRNAGRKFFACPIKKGQGACNFKKWLDLPGNGGGGEVARELIFCDVVTLSQHSEQRSSLSSGPSNGQILDMVANGGHVGEQSDSVGQGACNYGQNVDHPVKDRQGDEVAKEVKISDTGAPFQHGEQKSFSSGHFEGEILDREASDDHIAMQSDSEVSDPELHQFREQMELRYSSLSLGPSEGEIHDGDSSGTHIHVKLGSEGGDSLAGPKGDDDFMTDILLSTARHFANEFLKRIQGLSIPSFLHQRDQLVEAIQWVTSFGLECNAFVSQIDDLIELIDDFQALSLLAKQEEAIQQLRDQLSCIDSEDADRQARLDATKGEVKIMDQAEDTLVFEQAEVLVAGNTITEELRKLASDQQLLLAEVAAMEEAAAKSQQLRAELQEKIERARQENTEIFATLQTGYWKQEQLLEQLRISLGSLRLWD